jgi:hypothetical protein
MQPIPHRHRTRIVATALATTAFVACGADPSPPSPTVDLSMLPAVCERLDRLVAALEGAQPAATALTALPDAAPVRTLATEETTALRERVAALEAELAILRSRAFAGGSATMPRPADLPPLQPEPIRALARQLAEDGKSDGNSALRSVILMQPSEVIARLGMPSHSNVSTPGILRWRYDHGGQEVRLTFLNGIVVSID